MKTEVILSALEAKHPGEKEYLQAVKEVLLSIEEVYNQHPEFEKAKIIERLVEPERIFTFRVPWVDDKGKYKSTWDIVCNSTTRSARTRAASASILLSTCPS